MNVSKDQKRTINVSKYLAADDSLDMIFGAIWKDQIVVLTDLFSLEVSLISDTDA